MNNQTLTEIQKIEELTLNQMKKMESEGTLTNETAQMLTDYRNFAIQQLIGGTQQ